MERVWAIAEEGGSDRERENSPSRILKTTGTVDHDAAKIEANLTSP
jgi:hypothetical protein